MQYEDGCDFFFIIIIFFFNLFTETWRENFEEAGRQGCGFWECHLWARAPHVSRVDASLSSPRGHPRWVALYRAAWAMGAAGEVGGFYIHVFEVSPTKMCFYFLRSPRIGLESSLWCVESRLHTDRILSGTDSLPGKKQQAILSV